MHKHRNWTLKMWSDEALWKVKIENMIWWSFIKGENWKYDLIKLYKRGKLKIWSDKAL